MKITAVTLLAALLCLSAASSTEAASPDHRANKPQQLKVLPKAHQRIVHRNKPYYYSGGRFYRHSNGVYVSITAPIGAIVPALPGGYVTFGVGSNRYFYFGGVYYRQATNGYVVVKEPEQAETALASGSEKIMIYPAAGQSDQQKSQDKYECHEWAFNESGFDPTNPDSDALLRTDYQRAMEACLEARQYVVR